MQAYRKVLFTASRIKGSSSIIRGISPYFYKINYKELSSQLLTETYLTKGIMKKIVPHVQLRMNTQFKQCSQSMAPFYPPLYIVKLVNDQLKLDLIGFIAA